MSEEKTAEAKLAEAEAKLTEQTSKLAELEEKLKKVDNTEHFEKVKKERDEAKRKLKEIEEAEATAKGEFEKLANDRLAELEAERAEKLTLKEKADKLDSYEKTRREALLKEVTDEELRKVYEKYELSDLEIVVAKIRESKPDDGSSNQRHKKKDVEEKKPLFDYSKSNMPN